VKAAREVMNETIEAWKQVPDVSEEASPPPRSLASSRGNGLRSNVAVSFFSLLDLILVDVDYLGEEVNLLWFC
jgi:hypothetical protein